MKRAAFPAALMLALSAAAGAGISIEDGSQTPPWLPSAASRSGEGARPAPATPAGASDAALPSASPQEKARQEALRRAQESARVRRDLAARRRAPLEVTDMPARDVLKLLGDLGTLNIVVDPALAEAGIDLSASRVTLKLTGLTYEQALLLILPREVSYKVCAGYVLVTTLEKSWLPLRVGIYPLALLLAEVPDFGGQAPRFDLQAITQGASNIGQGGGNFGELFGAGAPAVVEDQNRATPETIVDLIIRHVRHEHDKRIAPWADEGGPASIQVLGGRLIVSQTPEGHAAVQRLLWKLGT
jgi:hypothetical protein